MKSNKKLSKKNHENLSATTSGMSYLNIPVFYHVPKNAGTYFIGIIMIFLRLFRRERTNWLEKDHEAIKNIEIYEGSKCIGRFICGDPNNYVVSQKMFSQKGDEQVHFTCDIKNLKSLHLKKLFIFFIVIESEGFTFSEKMLSLLSYGKFKFHKSMILRYPLDRAQSMFNYLSCKSSSDHEPTFGRISAKNLSSYLDSSFVEDSWVIRNFLNISDSQNMTQEDFDKVDDILYDIQCVDIKDTDKLVNLIFKRCFNYSIKNIPEGWLDIFANKNQTKKIKIKESELNPETSQKFHQRTHFDRQLWQNHCL